MAWLMRRAGLDDLDAIMGIEVSTFDTDAWSPRAMASELDNPHTYYLVALADDGDDIQGYAGLLSPRGAPQADIQTIAVAESARRKGLGRAMMLQLMTEARQRGASEVFLEVRADNPGAQTLYEQLGFEAIAVRPRYYQPDGVDAVVMRHALETPRASLAIGVDNDS